jgi:hypothetical protein
MYLYVYIYIYIYFSDDVIAFKTDIISAFKYMFKKYKAKGINTPIYEHFNLLLEDNFEDIFPKIVVPIENGDKGEKKRIRDTDVEENTKSSRTNKKEEEVNLNLVRISYKQKLAVKSIVHLLTKNPLAEPFLYPVDSRYILTYIRIYTYIYMGICIFVYIYIYIYMYMYILIDIVCIFMYVIEYNIYIIYTFLVLYI